MLKKLRVQPWAEFARAVKSGASAGRVAATVVSRTERRTRMGTKMGIIGLSDPTGHYEAVIFAEVDGVPVARAVCIPDVNQVLARMNGGLFPFGLFHFLRRRRIYTRGRMLMLEKLIRDGVDVVRLNMAHASHDWIRASIRRAISFCGSMSSARRASSAERSTALSAAKGAPCRAMGGSTPNRSG